MKIKDYIKSILLASLGAGLFAVAVAFFYDPFKIAPGGITGFAVIISHLFPIITTGTVVLLMNIPLLVLALLKFGKKFVALTIYSTTLSSVIMNLLEPLAAKYPIGTDDLLVPALCGALLDAVGLGLVFRSGGCTGGSDIIIKFLRQKYRHIRTGKMSLLVNAVVVTATFLAFGNFEIAVFTVIAMTVSSFVLDKVLYGGEAAKLIFIITDKYEEITEEILSKADLGVTLLKGEGAYLHREKNVIMCAAKRHTFPRVRDIVKETDPHAFLIISSATEIFGEGYKSYYTDEL